MWLESRLVSGDNGRKSNWVQIQQEGHHEFHFWIEWLKSINNKRLYT